MCFKWPKLGLHIALQQYRLYKGWFTCMMIVREMYYMTVRAELNVSWQMQTWWCYCGFSLSLSACLSVSQTLYNCRTSSGIYFLKNLEDNTILSEVMYPIFFPVKTYNNENTEENLKTQRVKYHWNHKMRRQSRSHQIFPSLSTGDTEDYRGGVTWSSSPSLYMAPQGLSFPVQYSFFYSWFLIRVGFKSHVLRVILSWKLREWNLYLPMVIVPVRKFFLKHGPTAFWSNLNIQTQACYRTIMIPLHLDMVKRKNTL